MCIQIHKDSFQALTASLPLSPYSFVNITSKIVPSVFSELNRVYLLVQVIFFQNHCVSMAESSDFIIFMNVIVKCQLYEMPKLLIKSTTIIKSLS